MKNSPYLNRVRPISLNDPDEAFNRAIQSGRLSDNQSSPVYAGKFMYMGTIDGKDLFKHIETRHYL